MRITRVLAAVAAGMLAVAGAVAAPPARTLKVDAVELVAGRVVEGKPEHTLERDGIGYLFATAESKAAFEKDPRKYEVADGGACGSMGPMSGVGDARRYAVHEGRIYFFASDGCRRTFLKDPSKCIETDEPPVTGTAEQVAAGKGAIGRMVAWAGGVEKLKSLETYRAAVTTTELSGGKEWTVVKETAVRFPGCFYQKEAWNESWFSTARSPEGGVSATSKGSEKVSEGQRRAFDRWMARWPVVLIKTCADPSAPGAVVCAGDGEGTVAGVPVEFVKVSQMGANTRLAIEKETGRLVQLGFRGRDGGGAGQVGDSVRTFTKYATVGGITLPTAYTVSVNGKEVKGAGLAFETFEVNPKMGDGLFSVQPPPTAHSLPRPSPNEARFPKARPA